MCKKVNFNVIEKYRTDNKEDIRKVIINIVNNLIKNEILEDSL